MADRGCSSAERPAEVSNARVRALVNNLLPREPPGSAARNTGAVATHATHEQASQPPALSRCRQCGSRLAHDQRYCIDCGQRRGPLAHAIGPLIGLPRPPLRTTGVASAAPDEPGAAGAAGPLGLGPFGHLSPPVTAVAVIALLAFGVLVGSAVTPTQQSSAVSPLIVAVSPAVPGAAASSSAAPSLPAPAQAGAPEAGTQVSTVVTTTSGAGTPASASQPSEPAPSSTPPPTALPAITHVFLIVLSDLGFNRAFGPGSQAPYLSKTLTRQGELVDNYFAVAGGELANEIALVSGQGPTPQTAANCPLYTDLAPGTAGPQGQLLGSGCVYPTRAQTLADQLTADGRAWKAYLEGIGGGGAGQPTACRHPALGLADPYRMPTAADPYVTWRDPFAYFHSVIDSANCANSVVGLEQLAPDLAAAPSTPALAYVVPDRCHDGSPEPCAPGQPSGPVAAESFLRQVVPEIEASPAYKAGGLIAITSDQAPQSGPEADSSGCCTSSPYPNLPPASAGVTGATGTTGATATTGATGASGPAGAGATTPSTGAGSGSGATGASETAGAGPASQVGGGKVGLLLISKFVKGASVNVIGQYNHFSLLASIEDLFGFSHLGYAGAPGLLVFDTSVYNAHH
jgi:hypothetical protein